MLKRLVLALVVTLAAGCAVRSNDATPVAQSAAQAIVILPQAGPPACKGQTAAKHFATVKEMLSTKGGSLCIPAFGGFGGTLVYPGVDKAVNVTLISSTTDYANVPLPIKSSLSPIFYLNVTPSGTTTFGTKLGSGGGLTSAKIKPKAIYTAFMEGHSYGLWHDLVRCYAVAGSGRYGGVIGGLGSLLIGQKVFGQSAFISFEIFVYSGQETYGKC